jgi:hypothetical protein
MFEFAGALTFKPATTRLKDKLLNRWFMFVECVTDDSLTRVTLEATIKHELHPVSDCEFQYRAGLRAERHSNSDLVCSLGH